MTLPVEPPTAVANRFQIDQAAEEVEGEGHDRAVGAGGVLDRAALKM